jgi:hypothetical protein
MIMLGAMVQAYNPSPWEAEMGGWSVQGLNGLQSENLSLKKQISKETEERWLLYVKHLYLLNMDFCDQNTKSDAYYEVIHNNKYF